MNLRRCLSVLVLTASVPVLPALALAEGLDGRESLVNLPGVVLDVRVAPWLNDYASDRDLRAHVETRLRAAGVRLLTEAQAAEIEGLETDKVLRRCGALCLRIDGLKAGDENFVDLDLSVGQIVWIPQKNEAVTLVVKTWESGRYSAMKPRHLQRGDLLSITDTIVNEFIDAWQATHPEVVPRPLVGTE